MTRPVDPEGLAARFIALEVHESTHDRLVWGMRHNRDKAVAGVPQWEELRELASQIKEHTLTPWITTWKSSRPTRPSSAPTSTGPAMPRSTTQSSTTS